MGIEACQDRQYYDSCYAGNVDNARRLQKVSSQHKHWNKELGCKTLLTHMGDDLTDKCVLLLDNGLPYKEFLLLTLGARVIYTDVWIEGVMRAKEAFQDSDFAPRFNEEPVKFFVSASQGTSFAD
ncbi:MAG: hypothetical protein ACYC1V_30750 [Pirellulaceae bacterium]